LRAVLKRSDGDFTTLGEELEIVRSYLAIEKARFEERLTVSMDVPDEMLAYQVPALVLQPLVENAVKHGIAPRKEGGVIVVSARVEDAGGAGTALVLTVADTGVGVPVRALKQRMAEGVGLSNIEKRLERYFGSNGRIELHSVVGVGTRVEVWIPPSIDGRDSTLAASA
jgi:two-component system LytT family sensor kinase